MISYKERHAQGQHPDRKLFFLFGVLAAALATCVLLFPNLLFRSSALLSNAYWRIASIGQERIHNQHAKVYDKQNGAVLIMFDDGWMSQYTQGYEIMKKYGFKGSVAVISDCVGQYDYMSIRELSSLYRAGWDMANHTRSHPWLKDLSKEAQKKELLDCKTWLKNYHLTGAEDIAIFPGGYSNKHTFEILTQEEFAAARSVENYWDITTKRRTGDITVISVTPNISICELEKMFEQTALEKSMLILIFHKFNDTPDAWGMSYPASDFEKICESIKINGLQVLTISEMQSFTTSCCQTISCP